ncbi:MAG: DUF2304 domain-containing protein [Nitrospiraceae bacterium]|nr:MAG: DUF2304 domain-containing protein [Nitrospiraceae bacterium]
MPLAARIIILSAGILLFIAVFELVRKKKFREELSIIWLFFAFTIAAGSVIDLVVDPLAKKLGIAYPPALAFMVISIVMVIALLYFSVVTSDLKGRVKELTQRIALLEFETGKKSGRKTDGNS